MFLRVDPAIGVEVRQSSSCPAGPSSSFVNLLECDGDLAAVTAEILREVLTVEDSVVQHEPSRVVENVELLPEEQDDLVTHIQFRSDS